MPKLGGTTPGPPLHGQARRLTQSVPVPHSGPWETSRPRPTLACRGGCFLGSSRFKMWIHLQQVKIKSSHENTYLAFPEKIAALAT